MAVQLASFADVKALLGLEQATSASYPKYTLIEPQVQASIVSYLGITLDSAAVTESVIVGLESTRFIPLRRMPIASVTTVEIDDVATTDYKLSTWGIRLGAAVREVTVDVSYTGGYTTAPDTVPTVLKRAAVLQVAYEMQSSEQIGAVSLTTDGGTVSRPELGLLKEVRRLLAPYRHPYFVGQV